MSKQRKTMRVKATGQRFFAFNLASIPFATTIASVSVGQHGRTPICPYQVDISLRKHRHPEMPTCLGGVIGERIAS